MKWTSRTLNVIEYVQNVGLPAYRDYKSGKSASEIVSHAYVNAMFATASIGAGAVAGIAFIALFSNPAGLVMLGGAAVSIAASAAFDYYTDKKKFGNKTIKERTYDFMSRPQSTSTRPVSSVHYYSNGA